MKFDRLVGILTVLLQNESVTAPYLARRFEVCRRTIGRDIDALCQAGIPVVTAQGSGGGISIAKGFKLDTSALTAEELSSMLAGLKGIGSVAEASRVQRLMEKLSLGAESVISLRESIVIDLASHYKGSLTDKIEAIKRAVRECRVIAFDYYYEKGEVRRRVEPYFVIFQWSAWYVFGYCLDREDWRLFKLTRLWGLRVTDSEYALREIPPAKRDFNARFSDDKRLVALFDPSVRYQLIETYGLDCCSQEKDGMLRLCVGYTNDAYMTAWLLGFGAKVKVIEPRHIADSIREEAKKMAAFYA